MVFKNKKKTTEKKELLYRENVKVGCKADTQENVSRQVGQMLVDSGYVDQPYVDAMLEREKSFSTYMGNDLALPHGVETAKQAIKASGIAVMVFPEGTPWGDEPARIARIAAVEHDRGDCPHRGGNRRCRRRTSSDPFCNSRQNVGAWGRRYTGERRC